MRNWFRNHLAWNWSRNHLAWNWFRNQLAEVVPGPVGGTRAGACWWNALGQLAERSVRGGPCVVPPRRTRS